MPSYPLITLGSRFTSTLQTFTSGDASFEQALSEELIQRVADDMDVHFAGGRNDIFTPVLTLWGFLAQVLSSSKSCVAAVARIMVLRVAVALPPCSANTGAYCKARGKLHEPFLRELTHTVGAAIEDQAPESWRWHGHRVLLVDGFDCTLPDTPENQAVYPQPSTQKPGLGFPMIRAVVLLTFATACIIDAAVGPYQGKETGETALFRQLLDRLRPGDVVVADRYYCSYWMIALLQQQGVAVAFRLHQVRHYDFRRGRRLGSDDHIVVWTKPQRPKWMDAQQYAALPDSLTVRELRFRVAATGYRSKEIVVATTLCDDEAYSKEALADLYHQRWHAELDIRAIKQTLQMDQLSCKTPEMVRREFWVHLLGYNLVRKVMAEAAWYKGLCPRQLSFAGAVQILEQFRLLLLLGSEEMRRKVTVLLWLAVATHEVGDRPGRVEPRCVKRRPKSYPPLTKPRQEARAELLNQ
jgi:putative transposase